MEELKTVFINTSRNLINSLYKQVGDEEVVMTDGARCGFENATALYMDEVGSH